MSAPEFDPELVEQAARALWEENAATPYLNQEQREERWSRERKAYLPLARAVLTAAAPILIAKGAGMNPTSYEWLCGERDKACQRGKVDGAREVLADLEAAIAEQRITLLNDGVRITTERIHAAAREAVARIEKEN